MGKKYLVTGGTGFIGAALVRRLVTEGHDVRVLDNNSRGALRRLADLSDSFKFTHADIRDLDAVTQASEGVESVIHLAAINGTEHFYARPEVVLDVGVRGMLNVVDACRSNNIGDLILASSSEVYQSPPSIPTGESVPLVVPDVKNPRYSYGGSKIISELICLNYELTNFDRITIFRPHNVYGPDMGWEHVLPQFSLRALKEIRKTPNGPIQFKIQGDGNQTRAFVHINDFIDGLKTVLKRGLHREIYNIGNTEEVKISQIANLIFAYFKREGHLIPSSEPIGATSKRCPDISKLQNLGYAPSITLEQGLPGLINWYVDNSHLAS